jgi:transposase
MSVQPQVFYLVPEETARVARAIFPTGNLVMRMYDELGMVLHDLDFVFRKGQRYGTILVNLERHRPIYLLPNRRAGTLTAWLKSHPDVEIVSRDRSSEYIRGIQSSAPHATQVVERFQVLVNLREMLERLVERYRGDLTGIMLSRQERTSVSSRAIRRPTRRTPSEEAVRQARSRMVRERVTHVQTLHAQGLSIRTIAQQLRLNRSTVRRDLRLDVETLPPRTRHVGSS